MEVESSGHFEGVKYINGVFGLGMRDGVGLGWVYLERVLL